MQTWLQLGVPFLTEALCVLVLGRTFGEWVVDTRTLARRRGPVLGWRLVKLVVGVGPILGLALLDGWWVLPGLAAYAVLAVVSNRVAGLEVEIDAPPPDGVSDQALEDRQRRVLHHRRECRPGQRR